MYVCCAATCRSCVWRLECRTGLLEEYVPRGAPPIDFLNLKRGMPVGVSIGIGLGISSLNYTHSVRHAVATALVTGSVAACVLGTIQAKAEQERRSKGITVKDIPLRPKLILQLTTVPRAAITLCRQVLQASDIKVKALKVDEALRIVAVTRGSFNSWGERITVEAKASDGCLLEISSVPRYPLTAMDTGINYMNVLTLAKGIKERIGADVANETWIDLDDPQRQVT
jgi:hypothetical protein